jgi:hypothetical protein
MKQVGDQSALEGYMPYMAGVITLNVLWNYDKPQCRKSDSGIIV